MFVGGGAVCLSALMAAAQPVWEKRAGGGFALAFEQGTFTCDSRGHLALKPKDQPTLEAGLFLWHDAYVYETLEGGKVGAEEIGADGALRVTGEWGTHAGSPPLRYAMTLTPGAADVAVRLEVEKSGELRLCDGIWGSLSTAVATGDERRVYLEPAADAPVGKSIEGVFRQTFVGRESGPAVVFRGESLCSLRSNGGVAHHHFEAKFAKWRDFKVGEKAVVKLTLAARDRSGTARFAVPHPINVLADKKAQGFVRVSKADPHYFAFDSGEGFVPLGHNVPIYHGSNGMSVKDIVEKMAANGENWNRWWMSKSGLGLEWESKLGWYRQAQAAKLDWLLEDAGRLEMYYQLCMDTHQDFRQGGGKANPFNAEQGGPCKTAGEWFTNESAKTLYRKRLRYTVARWGYSPHVFAWEFGNEFEGWADTKQETIIAWHREMAPFLASLDPYGHLISTSWWSKTGPEACWQIPELTYVQTHSYANNDLNVALETHDYCLTQWNGFRKPHVFAVSDEGAVSNDAELLDKLHGAGHRDLVNPPTFEVTYPADGEFVIRVDRVSNSGLLKIFVDDRLALERPLPCGEQCGKSWRYVPQWKLWESVYDEDVRVPVAAGAHRIRVENHAQHPDEIRPFPAAAYTLDGFSDGDYSVEWWETWRGVPQRRETVRASGGRLTLRPGPVATDLAAKVVPLASPSRK